MAGLNNVMKRMKTYVQRIKEICADEYGVTVEDIDAHSRHRTHTLARWTAMELVNRYTPLGHTEIARLFSRYSGSLTYPIQEARHLLKTNKAFNQTHKLITERIEDDE